MSKQAASADLQAAASWRNVAKSDRSEINVAVTKVSTLTTTARREEVEPTAAQRSGKGLGIG